MSTSSHPSLTPHAAPALGDDSLNFNSPTALMMSSLGSHGLTPLPSGADALGISTDMTALPTRHESVLGTRHPEEDKPRRLQEVVKLLRTSVAGRGICREGVERLAQLAGFTHMWQGDTLAIAGTCVDLEITFDNMKKDKVNDVVLKIFTPESEEHMRDASDVLKSNLEQSAHNSRQIPWQSLDCFAKNLEHLGSMDQLGQGFNCFEAIDGLYLTFRKIWEGEKERMGQRRTAHCLSRGAVGRPVLNKKRKLGLTVEYWAERTQLLDTEFSRKSDKATKLDHLPNELGSDEDAADFWTARIDCEVGYPSLRVSKEWLAENIWADSQGQGPPSIAWIEPPLTLVRPTDGGNDSNTAKAGDTAIRIPKPPHVRFFVSLEPSVLVPLSVASSVLSRPGLVTAVEQRKCTTYEQALQNLVFAPPPSEDTAAVPTSQRYKKAVATFDAEGKSVSHHHSYAIYSAPQIWCYPLQAVAIEHPKHLAELLPTIRQYVMLWTLLRRIAATVPASEEPGQAEDTAAPERSQTQARSQAQAQAQARGTEARTGGGVIRKSNLDSRRAKIAEIMGTQVNDGLFGANSASSALHDPDTTIALPVDVSLSWTSSPPSRPRLDLIWPLPIKSDAPSSDSRASFAGVSVEIGPNGEICVPSAVGIPWAESDKGLRGIAQALELGEDLGLLVEWIRAKTHT
jgi:Mediator of RNA polymerase II transcription subunit 1